MKKVGLLIGVIIASCLVYGQYKNCVRYEKNPWCQYTARSYCSNYTAPIGYKNCTRYEKNPWCHYRSRSYCQSNCQPSGQRGTMRAIEPAGAQISSGPFIPKKKEKNDKYYWSPLFWAIALEDVKEVKHLLDLLEQRYATDKKGLLEELNKQDWAGHTALYLAVEWIRKDILKIFINYAKKWFDNDRELFFDWITKSEYLLNWSPLYSAMFSSFSPAVQELIQSAEHILGKKSELFKQFINQKDIFGRTPLAVGIEPWDKIYVYNHGGIEIHSPDLHTQNHLKLKKDFLHFSSLMGHIKELREILDEGTLEAHEVPNPTKTRQLKNLLATAQSQYEHEKKFFLDFITARSSGGWTALMNAVVDGNAEYIKLILSAANNFFSKEKVWVAFIMNASDIHGRTVWHLAVSRHHIDIIKMLIKVQKEIADNRKQPFLRLITHQTELNGFTPLHAAVYESADDPITFQIIKLLIERAAEVLGVGTREFNAFINMRDYDGFSALDYATTHRVKALFKKYGVEHNTLIN